MRVLFALLVFLALISYATHVVGQMLDQQDDPSGLEIQTPELMMDPATISDEGYLA